MKIRIFQLINSSGLLSLKRFCNSALDISEELVEELGDYLMAASFTPRPLALYIGFGFPSICRGMVANWTLTPEIPVLDVPLMDLLSSSLCPFVSISAFRVRSRLRSHTLSHFTVTSCHKHIPHPHFLTPDRRILTLLC